jgi:hypothetical protein
VKRSAKQTANRVALAEVHPSFAPIVATFADQPNVSLGRMFSSGAVLTVNGKIFAMLVRGKLVVKLPKPRVDELMESGLGDRFDPGHGRVMKEWVAVGPGKTAWIELAREAHRFVGGGKP